MGNSTLLIASVASMIDLFNRDNIMILKNLGLKVGVAANFRSGSITSQQRVDEFKEELTKNEVDVVDIPCPRSILHIISIIQSYRIVKKLVEQNKYKIVHCHSPIGGVIARLACKRVRKKGTVVLYTAHGFHFFKGAPLLNWIIFFPIEYLCSKITDVIITINNEDYQRVGKWKTCKVKLVNGIGVHTREFQNDIVDRKSYRNVFGFKDHDFVFMSTGQLSKRKNHEVIIRAIAKINNPQVKYLIVGFGELEGKLKKLVANLGIQKQVVFAGYRGDVKDLLHTVDAFAFPSLQEGLPVALMEAMSVGLPVICSRIRGNIDLVQHGKGGYLCDCHDINGFADGMKKLISGAGNNMGKINMDTMKKYDVRIVNEQMRSIYNDIYCDQIDRLNE